MGLFGGGNNSTENVTNNNIDNSVLTVASGAVGVDGNNNRVTVTDGRAFEIIGDSFQDLSSSLIEGQEILANSTLDGLSLFLNSSDASTKLALESNTAMASNSLDHSLDVTKESYALIGKNLDRTTDLTNMALSAVENSNENMTENYETIARITSGDNSDMVNKVIMGLVGLGAIFAVTKMVKG
jgi:hypothetical protein